MTIHRPQSREEWLDLRHKYVGSTEVSALFGASPYVTAYELFHVKRTDKPTELEMSERMEWGLRLEEAIARSIADVYGVKVRKLNAYAATESGMGASFDYEIIGIKEEVEVEDKVLQGMYRDLGPGILEIKNVDYWVYKNSWVTDDKKLEAPAHIEIQVQAQLHTIERSWAAIGVLVGGNTLKMLIRERDPAVGERLEKAVQTFWRRVRSNKPPEIQLPQDAELISHIYNFAEPGKVLDAQSESEAAVEIERLVKEYDDASAFVKAHENRKKAAKAALLGLIGDSERVLCRDGYTISAGVVSAAQIPAYTREAYRNFRVTKKKEKA